MSTKLDLKQIERKAYRSFFQDGLIDIQYGLIVISMTIFLTRPSGGYGPGNILLMLVCFGLSNLLFWVGKRFVTLPRMGQVKFGETRKKSKRTMIFFLGIVVLIQVVVLLFTVFGWLNKDAANHVNHLLKSAGIMDMVVACIGALFVGTGMTVTAYFLDFPRGFYIAILMMLAVFLVLYTNQFIYPVMIGGLILIPGVVLFIRFLRKYPLPAAGVDHE